MSDIDVIMTKLDSIIERLDDVESRMIAPKQITTVGGLSDITEFLGTVSAGEIRAGLGTPGQGFTGTRIVYPGVVYDGEVWTVCGVSDDKLMVGFRSSDGKFVAGGGAVTADDLGIRIKTKGIENYHRRPLAIWHPDDPLEMTMRIRDPDNLPESSGTPVRQGNLTYRAPGDTSTYPFWTFDYKQNVETTASTAYHHWISQIGVMPTSTGYGVMYLEFFDVAADSDRKYQFGVTQPGSTEPVETYFKFKTQALEHVDADTTTATEEGWIEVRLGGNTSYIRTYAAK